MANLYLWINIQVPLYVFANWQWGPSGKTPSTNQQAYSWVLGQAAIDAEANLLWGAPISPGSFTPGSVHLPASGLSILSRNGKFIYR